MIQIGFQTSKGKIVENAQKIRDVITSLSDGNYILTIATINPLLTQRDYQNAYFAMVDTCVAETGNARYVIHDAFKKEFKVSTTKEFDIATWRTFISQFRFWAYNNMDVIV